MVSVKDLTWGQTSQFCRSESSKNIKFVFTTAQGCVPVLSEKKKKYFLKAAEKLNSVSNENHPT